MYFINRSFALSTPLFISRKTDGTGYKIKCQNPIRLLPRNIIINLFEL